MRPNFTAIWQISHTSVRRMDHTTKCGCPTTNATETFFNSAHSAVTKATLIEIANDVQQHEVYLSAHENKLMAQFQEMLSILQTANSGQSSTHASPSKRMKKEQNMQEKHNCGLVSTVGLMGATHTPELSATAKMTTTMTRLPSPTCSLELQQGVIGWKDDNLGCQIVVIS